MSIIVILSFSLQSLSTVVIIYLYLDLVKLHVAFLFYLLPFMVNKDEYMFMKHHRLSITKGPTATYDAIHQNVQ